MSSLNAPALPDPAESTVSNRAGKNTIETVANPTGGSRSTKPFIERRRQAPLQTAWPEALDAIQRQLVGYEIAQQGLIESEAKFRSIFEYAPIGIFQVLPDGRLQNANLEMARILGFESAEQYLKAAEEDPSLRLFESGQLRPALSVDPEKGDTSSVDLPIRCAQGALKWVHLNLRAVRDGGRITHFDGTAEDITARKSIEIRTEVLAYYDPQTGLPNRLLFQEKFGEIISRSNRASGRLALLLLECDSYKAISESLGERFSDRLLQEIVRRIRNEVGKRTVVARLGRAEFGIYLENCQGFGQIAETAASILSALSEEYSLPGHALNMFFSMGIGVLPASGKSFEGLLKNAEAAKWWAQNEGSCNFRIFSEEMDDLAHERVELESGLRLALARKEFFLEYQPEVDIRTGAVVGLEALLRWMSPQLGLVPPARFIGIAEDFNLIVPIGEWVLETACAQARIWQDRGLPPVPIAVNVSPVQFRQRSFCGVVQRALSRTGLRPECLELELTENLLVSNADLSPLTISELRKMGVKLAIDDFGTGYSSFGYLRQFKVHRLKIDRSFIKELSTNPDDAAIIIAMIKMANAMNLSVLAEGVETKEQLLFLREQNCEAIQGFYFSKPVPADEMERQLRVGFRELIPANVGHNRWEI